MHVSRCHEAPCLRVLIPAVPIDELGVRLVWRRVGLFNFRAFVCRPVDLFFYSWSFDRTWRGHQLRRDRGAQQAGWAGGRLDSAGTAGLRFSPSCELVVVGTWFVGFAELRVDTRTQQQQSSFRPAAASVLAQVYS